MSKIYLVKYCGGSFDDYYNAVVFATFKKSKAIKYCTKFNRILKKWKDYYSQYEDDDDGFKWIKDEFINQYYDRWYSLKKYTKCYYEEITVR
jgi:hypothetical protein